MQNADLTSKDLARLADVTDLMARQWSPCRWHCPVHADVRGYIEAAGEGRLREAIDIIRENLPFAAVCGRVCHHPCENNCRREGVDDPVAIREVKRFVAELAGAAGCTVRKADRQEKARVAIVGAGPAGLSAALELAMRGYRPTCFERFDVAGGIPATAIPRYRLPLAVTQIDVDWILAHGVELATGVEIGREKTLDGLLAEGFAAVVLAVGLADSRPLPMPGDDHPRVLRAMEFLTATAFGKRLFHNLPVGPRSSETAAGKAEEGGDSMERIVERPERSRRPPQPTEARAGCETASKPVDIGRRVLVIGGGNVACDCARTAVRLGAEVTMMCLEAADEMPAWAWEVRETEEEGIRILNRRGPVEVLRDAGGVTGVLTRKVTRVFDEAKRFNPRYDDADRAEVACDTVILAIGQMADFGFTTGSGLQVSDRGRLAYDPATQQTNLPNVFACGEIITPPGSVVEACASGKRAAAAVDLYLSGRPVAIDDTLPPAIDVIPEKTAEKVLKVARHPVPTDPPEQRRSRFTEMEHSYALSAAVDESRRCMNCGAGAEVLVDRCAACLTCLRVCPFDIPKVTDVARIESDKCQACGICIAECPANAIVPRCRPFDDLQRRTAAALATLDGGRKAVAYIGGYHAAAEDWRGESAPVPGVAEIYLGSTGRISAAEMLAAFEAGADAVIVVAAASGKDRYPQVAARTRLRVEQARGLLAEAGLDPAALHFVEVADQGRPAVAAALAAVFC